MNKSMLLLLIMGFLTISSCDDSSSELENLPPEPVDQPLKILSIENATPDDQTGQIASDESLAADPETIIKKKSAKGPVNPPHGKPGHRCDISVGALLSSPPNSGKSNPMPEFPDPGADPYSQQLNMVTEPAPVVKMPPPVPGVPYAPGMNPPHGQKGHICTLPADTTSKK
jgi:hypothetical protein